MKIVRKFHITQKDLKKYIAIKHLKNANIKNF